MLDYFTHDVFLSHSSKDKSTVREIAERLRNDGLKVWFDEWEIRPGDNIVAKIELGLETSRALVLCMSAQAFGSDWAQLESGVFRFRDPLNKNRRFIPLRLDDAPVKGSLSQFSYVDWRKGADKCYLQLLDACRPPQDKPPEGHLPDGSILSGQGGGWVGVTADGRKAISGGAGGVLQIWNLETRTLIAALPGHKQPIYGLALSADGRRAISGSHGDGDVILWDTDAPHSLAVVRGEGGGVHRVAISADGTIGVSTSDGGIASLWDIKSRELIRIFRHPSSSIWGVAISGNGRIIATGSAGNSIKIWDPEVNECLTTLEGHRGGVTCLAMNADGDILISASHDRTLKIWDLKEFRLVATLEGHTGEVLGVAMTPDGTLAISGSQDATNRVWDVRSGRLLATLQVSPQPTYGTAISADGLIALTSSGDGTIRTWDLSNVLGKWRKDAKSVQYTNAKVLFVGESGVGKTGLSRRVATGEWQPSDSTVGAWSTQWKLPAGTDGDVQREIWLWDFGGQADQRLIHQLYMDETALAVFMFDGQKDDVFDTLAQWNRDITRASRKSFTKLLVAGRVDAGGVRVARSQIEEAVKKWGYADFLETSAKSNEGCDKLRDAILKGIKWEEIPWRSSTLLFRKLRDEIVRLRDEGRVLIRFNDLRDILRLRLTGEDSQFSDDQLKAVIGLLAGPCVVWELAFGSWVLLQPERINAYGQAVIQTIRADEDERGCLSEEQILKGKLAYSSSMNRLNSDDERFVLLAMHQILVDRGLCLREHTDQGTVLIFPCYYRRERPQMIRQGDVLVSYQFAGFIDEIYTTLVVKLHHAKPFHRGNLWRDGAEFTTLAGKPLGLRLARRSEGAGELEVYFDRDIPEDEKIIFAVYVHDHLNRCAQDVVRLRHYICPHCHTPIGNREVAMKKLIEGKKDMLCANCDDTDKRVPLWDKLEMLFSSPEIKHRVEELERESAIVLSTQSKERILVGEVISTVALANQICRELGVSDQGIDMEIEFTRENDEATNRKLYLQLKSGDSHLYQRKNDGAEVFTIKDERHVKYWMESAFPVMLVIRDSQGHVRWMEIQEYLRRESANGTKPVRQIIFKGEKLDVMSIRRWRERSLDE